MIITLPWLKEHLKTKANQTEIINKLTNIGLEVEGIKENNNHFKELKIAQIIKAENINLANLPILLGIMVHL